MTGKVVRVIAGFYDIVSDGVEYRTRGSGNLRNEGFSPVVGDVVDFKEDGFLTFIHPRRNSLIRPKVANVDQAIVVTSLKEPNYSSMLLNRILAIVEHNDINPVLVFTKSDLTEERPNEEYEKQGYSTFLIDNNRPETLDKLANVFKGKLSVFVGQSGAGKSSTINNLAKTNIKTQEISKALGRGKHTTRVVEIIEWHGGELIDTPGFSNLEFSMNKIDLSKSYFDFRKLSSECQFPKNCLHNKEKNCAIKRAVESGEVSKQRYLDYIRILEEDINE